MKAILVNEDRSLRWDEVPNPILTEDEVLIRVKYAALNRADLMQREGEYPPPEGCPEWMGLEVSGEIIEMTEGAKAKSIYKIGDKVCALLGGGGYAEFVSVRFDMCMPVPKNCTMAKAFGLRVITTVISDPENIQHLGADLVVDTREQNLPEILKKEETEGRAVDIAIDCLGGQNLGECLPYVKYGCCWIVIAALAGANTTIDHKNIYKKNIRIVGSTLRSRTPEMKAEILSKLVSEVWEKGASGEIKPTVHKVLPITEAEEAHDILYRGKNIGKVGLKVQ